MGCFERHWFSGIANRGKDGNPCRTFRVTG